MSIAIPGSSIESLQQIETVVSGPDGANRLYVITGRLPVQLVFGGQSNSFERATETYTVLIGPVFTRRQFVNAISSVSVAETTLYSPSSPFGATWSITDDSADWDDQSGHVKLVIGVSLQVLGAGNQATLGKVSFQATILAEMDN